MPFTDLPLSKTILQAVADAGYTEPTEIQAAAIPAVLMGRDLIGVAQTGTGKTASFVLPMIDILAEGRSRARMPRALILEPTRELATQVAENFEAYGKYHRLSMVLLIGGVAFGQQEKGLEKGADVLVATPGRLLDQHERGNILLSGVDMFVIDEADRMLDMGFIPDVERICTLINPRRQTLLFSATMPDPIRKLADRFMENPRIVEVARPATTNENIEQHIVPVEPRQKRAVLRHLLDTSGDVTAIVFANRKTTVSDLAKSLARNGYAAGQIHGNMAQPDRLKELERFRNGEINILVASDVAARGLDIKGVSHIFNYDTPWHPDDYVHRVGRTGRAGATGIAYTFVTGEDAEAIARIEKLTGQTIPRMGKAPATKSAAALRKKPEEKAGDSDSAPKPASKRTDGRARKPRAERKSGGHTRPENTHSESRSAARAERPVESAARPAPRSDRRPPASPHEEESTPGFGALPPPAFLAMGIANPARRAADKPNAAKAAKPAKSTKSVRTKSVRTKKAPKPAPEASDAV